MASILRALRLRLRSFGGNGGRGEVKKHVKCFSGRLHRQRPSVSQMLFSPRASCSRVFSPRFGEEGEEKRIGWCSLGKVDSLGKARR